MTGGAHRPGDAIPLRLYSTTKFCSGLWTKRMWCRTYYESIWYRNIYFYEFVLSILFTHRSIEWYEEWQRIQNWKGRGRKYPWRNLMYYPGICIEGLARTTNFLTISSPGRDSNCAPLNTLDALLLEPFAFVTRMYGFMKLQHNEPTFW